MDGQENQTSPSNGRARMNTDRILSNENVAASVPAQAVAAASRRLPSSWRRIET